MASGTIECIVKSIDYGGGIGHVTMKSVFNWNVDANSVLTVSYDHSESISGGAQSWGICGTTTGYGIYAFAQYSTDGVNWVDIMSAPVVEVAICPSLTNVYNTMATCFSQFRPAQLTDSGQLRIVYGANRAPAPSASLPNSFPSYVQTEGQQVPVHIDVSWDAKLRYNANGGSNAPAGETVKEAGASHTFTVSNQQPTRKHFDFKGWATSASATTATIHGGDRVTVTKENPRLELYAVWEYTYRPGMIRVNGVWKSCDRDTDLSGGKYATMLGRCHIRKNGAWVEMRTRANRTGTEHAPVIRRNGAWVSMALIGDEGAPHDVSY